MIFPHIHATQHNKATDIALMKPHSEVQQLRPPTFIAPLPDWLPSLCRVNGNGTPTLQLINVTIMLDPVELQVRYWIHISTYSVSTERHVYQ